jgi:cyclophilin family peptidyl-prolyl cis-trans isomerase/protein-disulfide isomerase
MGYLTKQIRFRNSLIITLMIMVACSGSPISSPSPRIESTGTATIIPKVDNKSLCQSIPIAPTAGPEEKSIFPTVNENDHTRGPTTADVVMIEYGDFQCPGCASLAPILSQLEEKYSNNLKVVFRQLPLYDIHDKALLAAQASESASDLGKFWEMHDLLFENYEKWRSLSPDDFTNWLVEQASSMGIDRAIFEISLTSQLIVDRVQTDLENALKIGLRTTPFLLINGQMYNGPRDYNSLDQIISLIVLGKHQFTSCPEMSIDPLKQYIATLHTEKGDITLQLFPDQAPEAVNSFIFLARNGWYDNNTFFRVVPGFIAQTGDPSSTGLGTPGYLFKNEIGSSLLFDHPGVVAMANNGDGTYGSQFFITLDARMDLNGNYTIFGQVIAGMEILLKLSLRDPATQGNSPPGDLLENITITEN